MTRPEAFTIDVLSTERDLGNCRGKLITGIATCSIGDFRKYIERRPSWTHGPLVHLLVAVTAVNSTNCFNT